MAKNKKQSGKRRGHRELQGAIEVLEDVEKDVARVRANLEKFFNEAEEVLEGGTIYKRPPVVPRPPPKIRRK
jgi:hypothetical protein